eukprot:m.171449 g.171449  ORF g.171449 m.171449 type:complete len:330 (-) comp13377_c0_seq1:58-1047(-)
MPKATETPKAVKVTADMLATSTSEASDRLTPRRTEEMYIDTGGMLAFDTRPIDEDALKRDREGYLKERARENTQLLINAMWEHPRELVEDCFMLELPQPRYRLPREKPIPEAKPKTKWEQYADLKGIQKRKRSRMEFDEDTQEYKPRYGYGSKANEEPAVIELPDQADPFEDQFEKRAQSKSERIQKNKKQQLRNLADARKAAENAHSFAERSAVKDQLKTAFAITKTSTASVGKFDEKLKDEIKVKKRGKQKQRDPVAGDMKAEKARALAVLSKVQKKAVTIHTKKGVRAADDQAPAGVGKASAGKGKRQQTRFAPKGPSKRQKKQGM